jgi:hypothetical protein
MKMFLEGIDRIGDGEADIYLSDYLLEKVEQIKPLSPLRWVELNGTLRPGFGEGKVTINGNDFNVRYAWGGRSKPNGGWEDRTSYTVRLKTDNADRTKLMDIRVQIIKDEHEGNLYYEESFQVNAARFYKALYDIEVNAPEVYRKCIEKNNEECEKLNNDEHIKVNDAKYQRNRIPTYTEEQIDHMVQVFAQKWEANINVKCYYPMRKIEPDML